LLLKEETSFVHKANHNNYNLMKKFNIHFVFLLCSIFLVSCSSSDDNQEIAPILQDAPPTPNDPVTDDFLLIAATSLGEVLTIGDNTGDITGIAQINKEDSNSFLPMQTLIGADDTIYAVEYLYNPGPTNNLLIYQISRKSFL